MVYTHGLGPCPARGGGSSPLSPTINYMQDVDIHKAAGIIIKDKKLLLTKSFNKTVYVSPGGKLEAGETAKQALVRELKEELNIAVTEVDLQEFGTFRAEAAGKPGFFVTMQVFVVKSWVGDFIPSNEVESTLWVGKNIPEDIEIGSIFKHDVLPRLVAESLIS